MDDTLRSMLITALLFIQLACENGESATSKQFSNSADMQFALIPSGDFVMGSPEGERGRQKDEQEHRVQITRAFYIQTTEVTQKQWASVMNTEPWANRKDAASGPSYPATWITWTEANEFCKRLSEREGRSYRLPTEAEWEYACRAGSTTRYCFGDEFARLDQYAWVTGKLTDEGIYNRPRHAQTVALKKPNSFGLYDMHGNAWEWCHDWYSDTYYVLSPTANPPGPETGTDRVFRGGDWFQGAAASRSAMRNQRSPEFRLFSLGFRVACNEDTGPAGTD